MNEGVCLFIFMGKGWCEGSIRKAREFPDLGIQASAFPNTHFILDVSNNKIFNIWREKYIVCKSYSSGSYTLICVSFVWLKIWHLNLTWSLYISYLIMYLSLPKLSIVKIISHMLSILSEKLHQDFIAFPLTLKISNSGVSWEFKASWV